MLLSSFQWASKPGRSTLHRSAEAWPGGANPPEHLLNHFKRNLVGNVLLYQLVVLISCNTFMLIMKIHRPINDTQRRKHMEIHCVPNSAPTLTAPARLSCVYYYYFWQNLQKWKSILIWSHPTCLLYHLLMQFIVLVDFVENSVTFSGFHDFSLLQSNDLPSEFLSRNSRPRRMLKNWL